MGNVVSDSSLNLSDVERCVVLVRGKRVIIDHDVAALYNVETKRVNEAVKNNPEKFPAGYVIELTSEDVVCLRSKNSTLNGLGRGKHSKYLPKAFTEKGLYMLATGSMSHNGCAKVWRAVTVFWPKQSQLWLKSGN